MIIAGAFLIYLCVGCQDGRLRCRYNGLSLSVYGLIVCSWMSRRSRQRIQHKFYDSVSGWWSNKTEMTKNNVFAFNVSLCVCSFVCLCCPAMAVCLFHPLSFALYFLVHVFTGLCIPSHSICFVLYSSYLRPSTTCTFSPYYPSCPPVFLLAAIGMPCTVIHICRLLADDHVYYRSFWTFEVGSWAVADPTFCHVVFLWVLICKSQLRLLCQLW